MNYMFKTKQTKNELKKIFILTKIMDAVLIDVFFFHFISYLIL